MDDLVRESEQPAPRVNGRWLPGQSGNLRGRSESDYTRAVRALRMRNIGRCQGLLDKLYELGANGDSKSAEIYLRFVMAAPKPVEAGIAFKFDGASTTELLGSIFKLASKGEFGAETFNKLLLSIAPHLDAPLLELKREVEKYGATR